MFSIIYVVKLTCVQRMHSGLSNVDDETLFELMKKEINLKPKQKKQFMCPYIYVSAENFFYLKNFNFSNKFCMNTISHTNEHISRTFWND